MQAALSLAQKQETKVDLEGSICSSAKMQLVQSAALGGSVRDSSATYEVESEGGELATAALGEAEW